MTLTGRGERDQPICADRVAGRVGEASPDADRYPVHVYPVHVPLVFGWHTRHPLRRHRQLNRFLRVLGIIGHDGTLHA